MFEKVRVELMKMKSEKVKMPPRKFVRVPERPEWEGKRVKMVHVRDWSQINNDDMWAEMSKVTSQIHQSDVMICQEVTVELTDVSTQAELTPSNALREIGFMSGERGSRGRRVTPKKAPPAPRKASPVVGPPLSSGVFTTRTFRANEEVDQSTAALMREEAAPGQTDVHLTGLVSRSARRKAEGNLRLRRPFHLHQHRPPPARRRERGRTN